MKHPRKAKLQLRNNYQVKLRWQRLEAELSKFFADCMAPAKCFYLQEHQVLDTYFEWAKENVVPPFREQDVLIWLAKQEGVLTLVVNGEFQFMNVVIKHHWKLEGAE
ncbi:hypothetical protein [Maritalea sp.]|uniref:hypothetical protein n=1 Tax=Maritalea sp. TaxID=2003361 RepID=UPI003EF5D7F5